MTAATEAYAARRPSEFLRWLRDELRPRPGRSTEVARIAVNCTITVVVAMVFQIPEPAIMATLVFGISREQRVGTLITTIAFIVAATLAVSLSLALYTINAAEPSLRLALMPVTAFLAFFLATTSKIGPIAFPAGFVLFYTQTFIDGMPSTEALTRSVLWFWFIFAFPASLTALVDLLFGRDPVKLTQQTALEVLDSVAAMLQGKRAIDVDRAEAASLQLLQLRHYAEMADRRLRARTAVDHRLIEMLVELVTLLRALPRDVPESVRRVLAEACMQCRGALESPDVPLAPCPTLADAALNDLTSDVRPVVVAIGNTLRRFHDELARRREASDAQAARPKASLFVADAFTNHEHVRFALKGTLAVMAGYLTYTVLDWPGIGTVIPTCFFVAQGTLGETRQKFIQRISGALIGGLAAGLCVVYVFPHMTDIGQLALVVAAASAASAWVATSSALLSYAGIQIALAFFLGALQGYGPATEVTVVWDHFVGIMLGNVLMAISFSVMWPTSAFDHARSAIARALLAFADLIRDVTKSATDTPLLAVEALADARRFVSIAAFEASMLGADRAHESIQLSTVGDLERLGAAALVVANQSGDPGANHTLDAATASWFVEAAHSFDVDKPPPLPPEPASMDQAQAAVAIDAAPHLRAAIEARVLLQHEIEHVATAAP